MLVSLIFMFVNLFFALYSFHHGYRFSGWVNMIASWVNMVAVYTLITHPH